MNQAIRLSGECESRMPTGYDCHDYTPESMIIKTKRGPGKGRTRIVMVVPSRAMRLMRSNRRFKANIKKFDGSVARVLLEDVIGRKPGMYRKKVTPQQPKPGVPMVVNGKVFR